MTSLHINGLPPDKDQIDHIYRCSICGEMPRLTVKGFRGRPWKLCLNDDCPSMVEMREKRAEREAARAAKKEMKEKAEANGEDGAKAPKGPPDPGTRRRKRAKKKSPVDSR